MEIAMFIYIIVWGLVYFAAMKSEPEANTVQSILYAATALLWPVMLIDALLTKIYALIRYRGD